jgi:hypothetical protein
MYLTRRLFELQIDYLEIDNIYSGRKYLKIITINKISDIYIIPKRIGMDSSKVLKINWQTVKNKDIFLLIFIPIIIPIVLGFLIFFDIRDKSEDFKLFFTNAIDIYREKIKYIFEFKGAIKKITIKNNQLLFAKKNLDVYSFDSFDKEIL